MGGKIKMSEGDSELIAIGILDLLTLVHTFKSI